MGLIWTLIIGLVVGAIAKLLTSGKSPEGCLMTSFLGIAGSFIASFLGRFLGIYHAGEKAGFLASIIGAVIIIVLYNKLRD